jgi:hypothetical protein
VSYAGVVSQRNDQENKMTKKMQTTKEPCPHWGLKTETERRKVKQWLAKRKRAGLKIHPETAEVTWSYECTLDPYGVYPEVPPEYQQVGREYFARAPRSKIWVLFDDLPAATRRALLKKQ